MATLLLRITVAGKTKQVLVARDIAIPAEPYAQYLLLNLETLQPVKSIKQVHQGDHLLLSSAGHPAVHIKHFYSQKAALQNEYTAPATKNNDTFVYENNPTFIEEKSPEKTEAQVHSKNSSHSWLGNWLDFKSGTLLAGGLAVLGGKYFNNDQEPEQSGLGGTGHRIDGVIAAGQVIAGNGLVVQVYDQNRKLLHSDPVKVNDDGSFTVAVGNYQGAVFAKVTDTNTKPDYKDEATGDKNLSTELWAMGKLMSDKLTLTISPLSTIAYYKASDFDKTVPDPQKIDSYNSATASAFGLPDINIKPVLVNSTEAKFDATNALSKEEAYGAVLASLSGIDYLNTQKEGTKTTITDLTKDLVVKDTYGYFSSQSQTMLSSGIKTYIESASTSKAFVYFDKSISTLTLPSNVTGGEVFFQAHATGVGNVSYQLSGINANLFHLDSQSGQLSFINTPGANAPSKYGITISAQDSQSNHVESSMTLVTSTSNTTASNITPVSENIVTSSSSPSVNVVFDLIEGTSSAGTRSFSTDTSYHLYIRVPANGHDFFNTATNLWKSWQSAQNLNSDDKITLVCTPPAPNETPWQLKQLNQASKLISWHSAQGNQAVKLTASGLLQRISHQKLAQIDLWTGQAAVLKLHVTTTPLYLTALPV